MGENGSASYSVQLVGEAPLLTDRGDKSQRGAEYSALEAPESAGRREGNRATGAHFLQWGG